MVSILRGRWLTPATTVMLVALAVGPASGFFHGHETGASDDHCAVCHSHHVSAIETRHAHLGFEAVAHTLTRGRPRPSVTSASASTSAAVPPCPPRSSPERSDTSDRPAEQAQPVPWAIVQAADVATRLRAMRLDPAGEPLAEAQSPELGLRRLAVQRPEAGNATSVFALPELRRDARKEQGARSKE